MKDFALWLLLVASTVLTCLGVAKLTSLPAPIWYCIDGHVYEKVGEYYASVVPARTCLPVKE